MKIRITLIAILFAITNVFAQEKSQQEIVIIGTMHAVPKIVKKSYKPMLKFAKKYNPEAIYVESPMANDDKSWEYLKEGWSKNYQRFYKRSEEMKKTFPFDEAKFNSLYKKSYADLTTDEIDYMINSFIYKRDNGNYELYSYLRNHGVKGSKKPTRHEDGDLSYKLALSKNLKVINMDDQQTNKEFHIGWQKCVKEGRENGNNAINAKLNKKHYNRAILPGIFRNLGHYVNKRKTLERLDAMSSLSYAKVKTEGCVQGKKYFDERNMRMAYNIATQVKKSNKKRNLVIVGAAHVIGLEKEFKEKYPELKVILMNDF